MKAPNPTRPEGGPLSVRILGIDPGFANVGWSILDWLPDEKRMLLIEAGVFETKLTPEKKRPGTKSADDLRRVGEVSEFLREKVAFGYAAGVDVITPEAMSWGTPNAGTMLRLAMFWGALGAVASEAGIAVVQVPVQTLKKEATGRMTAHKEDVAEALALKVEGLPEVLKATKRTAIEHLADSVGAAWAARNTEMMRVIVAARRRA